MSFELERVLYATEDYLRRNLASRTGREAQKRRARRKLEEALRRLRRAAFLFVGLLAGLVLFAVAIEPIGFLTWLVALPTLVLVALVSLLWPTRQARGPAPSPAAAPATMPLDELAGRAEEALLDRCEELPRRTLPAADRILAGLRELRSHLGGIDPQATLADDARRLIGQHLPMLVDTYLALPDQARAPGTESTERFAESLGIVADEIDTLLDQCCRDKQMRFDTQNRFIESRYSEDGRLRGE